MTCFIAPFREKNSLAIFQVSLGDAYQKLLSLLHSAVGSEVDRLQSADGGQGMLPYVVLQSASGA
jgi:hypothetical protein